MTKIKYNSIQCLSKQNNVIIIPTTRDVYTCISEDLQCGIQLVLAIWILTWYDELNTTGVFLIQHKIAIQLDLYKNS